MHISINDSIKGSGECDFFLFVFFLRLQHTLEVAFDPHLFSVIFTLHLSLICFRLFVIVFALICFVWGGVCFCFPHCVECVILQVYFGCDETKIINEMSNDNFSNCSISAWL